MRRSRTCIPITPICTTGIGTESWMVGLNHVVVSGANHSETGEKGGARTARTNAAGEPYEFQSAPRRVRSLPAEDQASLLRAVAKPADAAANAESTWF